MKRPVFLLLFVGVAALPMPASARAIYFHKPGVERATVERDYFDCNELAGGVRVAPQNIASGNLYATAAGSFFAGFFRSRERRSLMDNVMRTCMADRGYRRVAASKDLVRELDSLPEKERVERLYAVSAAPEIRGESLPR